jgi:hypothetical protein
LGITPHIIVPDDSTPSRRARRPAVDRGARPGLHGQPGRTDLRPRRVHAPGHRVVVASPSLDCVSHTCLRVPLSKELPPGSAFPSGNNGLCTAECSSDGDCDRVPESPCITGFTCGIAVTVGPFCCKKFCICKDYIVVPDSGELAVPKACNPDDSQNACCNLTGRKDAAAYPLCKS